jgi:hypothetical protein
MNPDTGVFEAVAGLTQHGRVRDDWGHWFGCDNSRMLFQFPIEDRYVQRNPRVAGPAPSVNVPGYPDSSRIFPISAAFERYNHPRVLATRPPHAGLAFTAMISSAPRCAVMRSPANRSTTWFTAR